MVEHFLNTSLKYVVLGVFWVRELDLLVAYFLNRHLKSDSLRTIKILPGTHKP